MRMLICGDRDWPDKEWIRRVLREKNPDELITGGARGADNQAYDCSIEEGYRDVKLEDLETERLKGGKITVRIYADWDLHGRSAGPIRNRVMLDLEPDLVAAFHNNLDESKGTKDTVTEARHRNIPVELYGTPPPKVLDSFL